MKLGRGLGWRFREIGRRREREIGKRQSKGLKRRKERGAETCGESQGDSVK